jgi:hypothetical protein
VKLRVIVALLAVTGCAGPEVVHTGSAASTHATVHRTTARPTRPVQHPVATAPAGPVVTRDAECPYLETAFVMQTVGQHIERTTVTTTRPASCAFYRPDGALAAKVDGSELGSAAAAAAKVRAVSGSGANPVSDLGDGGAVAITNDGAVLAASTGSTLLVVSINQQSSLEATELARRYLARL